MKVCPTRLHNTNILNDTLKSVDYCDANHEYCSYITELMNKYFEEKEINISENFINRYLQIVCNNILCWSLNYDKHLKNCEYIIKNINFDKINTLKKIENNPEIYELYIKYEKNISIEFITNITNISNNQDVFIKFLKNYIENIIKSDIGLDVLFNFIITKQYINALDFLLDSKIKIPNSDIFNKIIVKLVVFQNDFDVILKKCITNGANIEKNTLKNVFNEIQKSQYIHSYNCINIFKITSFLFDNGSTDISWFDLSNLKDKILFSELSKIINHFVDNGYNLTQDEFKNICEFGIKINNFNKINKFCSIEEIKNIIYINKINYPIKFTFNIDILRSECKKNNNLPNIKNILKTIAPDTECLENTCINSNPAIVKIIHENYNIKFTDKCILNCAENFRYNRLFDYVLKLYKDKNGLNPNNNEDDNPDNIMIEIDNGEDADDD